ncbi:hypothetical protein B0A48_17573 [Cryoendolithus antarcticus]|uniref:DUF155 domain-containing protein n=1 Tax=Cryoendolithus antarcticus TaxID=1507870 RepID=A0A1V8SBB6_9PEZI|nr:hypothetical protein B0A48_17573 [Cryoendolithus antarcticus]
MSIAAPRGPPKRGGPTVLVTDARDKPRPPQSAINRPGAARRDTRVISVDHVLAYSSDIPSAQPRAAPGPRPAVSNRTPSGRHPANPRLGKEPNFTPRGVPMGAAHIPSRSSKVSEKLVLLPEADHESDDEEGDEEDESAKPPDDEEVKRRRSGKGGKSDAERKPKAQRIADPELARVTAYCTAQSYKLRAMATFVRDHHGAKTKLYDDCLYCVYQLPLLGGSDGHRVRSSPVVKNPGGRSVLDEQIEANERREYRDGWRDESSEYSVVGNDGTHAAPIAQEEMTEIPQQREEDGHHYPDNNDPPHLQDNAPHEHSESEMPNGPTRRESEHSTHSVESPFPSPHNLVSPTASTVAEAYIFSYGVAVLWNFTLHQEKDLLADLTFSSAPSKSSHKSPFTQTPIPTQLPLLTRPLDESEFETEEFHFQYTPSIPKPRIYNDMITLRTSDHMIKLAMSHAIGQSTKLSFFEERMQRTMSEAQYVPRQLALQGRLGMNRKEVVGLVGRLFEGRVDVNLSSNMLDVPNFFWDSEPTLHPLYLAVREYLEIKPRIQVLNERCKVFLDLAEILSDSIADVKMTRITWIIIVLILVSILVTCTEVLLRFAILVKSGGAGGAGKEGAGGTVFGMGMGDVPVGFSTGLARMVIRSVRSL